MKNDLLTTVQSADIQDVLKALCRVDDPTESQFTAFKKFYYERTQFSQTGDVSISINRPGLPSHEHVLRAVIKLHSQCDEKLEEFQMSAFPNCSIKDRKSASRITTRLAFMVDPFSRDEFPMAYRIENENTFPVKWQPSQTFIQFFHTAFPTESLDCWNLSSRNSRLKAWKLKKRLGINLYPTNDLAEHLVYNPRQKTLAIFHQVEYLKAQIRYTAGRSLEETPETSIANGTMPPQLLVETLYSIYHILFPLATHKKSAKLAKRLTRANGLDGSSDSTFDPDLIEYDGLIRQLPDDFKFIYWTKRLKALQAVVDHPPPANKIISWFERHTSERNALTVAILGLFLTSLFGLLSFLVGVAQLVVSMSA